MKLAERCLCCPVCQSDDLLESRLPAGHGHLEGAPLRRNRVANRPGQDLRRVFYYGYHNDDPKQIFRSSLPIGRVLEDPFDLPPVIACYKLNGQWLSD